MKFFIVLTLVLIIGQNLLAQEIEELSFEELNKKIRAPHEAELLVVNFWATWCKPCIKELPYFDSLQSHYPTEKVKVVLVNLDMEAEAAKKYRERKSLRSEVVFLDEVDHNAWIDRISSDWSGAIPATLFVEDSGQEQFHEGELSDEALFSQVNQLLNSK